MASYVYNAPQEIAVRVEKDVGGSYTEYIFGKDGNPLGENNRTIWVDTWVDFDGQHIAHYENGGVYYTYSNQVGTAGIVTDWTGAVVQDDLHYPWGQAFTTIGTQTEERFASLHHRDSATNLDPTHFRMYSSDEGRWLAPDPAQADIYNPQAMESYAYAAGNPATETDALGLGLQYSFGNRCVWETTSISTMTVDASGMMQDWVAWTAGGAYIALHAMCAIRALGPKEEPLNRGWRRHCFACRRPTRNRGLQQPAGAGAQPATTISAFLTGAFPSFRPPQPHGQSQND